MSEMPPGYVPLTIFLGDDRRLFISRNRKQATTTVKLLHTHETPMAAAPDVMVHEDVEAASFTLTDDQLTHLYEWVKPIIEANGP